MHVSGERYAALQALQAVYPIPDVFTRDEAEAQVKAVTENYLVKPSRLPLPGFSNAAVTDVCDPPPQFNPPVLYLDANFKTLRGVFMFFWGVFMYGWGNQLKKCLSYFAKFQLMTIFNKKSVKKHDPKVSRNDVFVGIFFCFAPLTRRGTC